MGLSALIGFNGLFPFSCWGSFLLQKFFQTLSFFLLPLRPLYSNTDAFNIVPEVSDTLLISFHSFFFDLFFGSISTSLSYSSFILSSASIIWLLILSSVLYISVIVLFISVCSLNLLFLVKHFLYLLDLCLHSFFKILNHLYYHYSELFFR